VRTSKLIHSTKIFTSVLGKKVENLCNYKKVKQSHNTPMEAQGERRYSSYSLTTSALDGVSGQRYNPPAFYSRGKDPPAIKRPEREANH
jgi:hypothetical protein